MSQVKTLPITATRWLSLLLCAITAATITVFLSKVGFVQKTYSSWSAILNASPVLHYSSAFLAGIGVKLLFDKFYISHPKRSIGFNWRYPPMTIAVLVSLFITAFYMLSTAPKFDEAALYAQGFMSLKYLALTFIGMIITVIYQAKLYTQKPIFTAVLVALSLIYIVFAVSLADITPAFNVFMYLAASYLILAIYLLCDEHRQSKQQGFTSEGEPDEAKEIPELKTLAHFREWFKDDSTIKSTEELELDLQVYATRITERLQYGGNKDLAQHIALCGPYGCGKSSIVESVVHDLAKNSQKESIWIHSDISTWGAASGSVAHVVLSNIIDDISQQIDMCAFRALPKHYTEAMKSGGSIFQFASTLLAGPVDIEESFKKLNAVLEITNHKLLITLQDVDRGTGDENEKRLNDIAALLDRLKNRDLSHINFIVAMGNENEVAAEVISKATDYREDILRADLSAVINSFIQESIKEALQLNKVIILSNNMPAVTLDPSRIEDRLSVHVFCKRTEFMEALKKRNNLFIEEVNALKTVIVSIRQLKKVLRRVNQAWNPERLMGEVNLLSLLMACALREVRPASFSSLERHYDSLIKDSSKNVAHIIHDLVGEQDKIYFNFYKVLLGLIEQKESEPNKIQKSPQNNDDQKVEALNRIADNFDKKAATTKPKLIFNKYYRTTQLLSCNDPDICYLKRIVKEDILDGELREQEVFRRFIVPDDLYKLAGDLCHDLKFQHVVWRFEYIIFTVQNPICRVTTSEGLFELIINVLREEYYTHGYLFESIFSRLTLQIIRKENFEDVATKIANLSDPDLSLRFLNTLRKNASSLGGILIGTDFNKLSSVFLDGDIFDEHLLILSALNSYSIKNAGDKTNYDFILRLFLERTDEKSLCLLVDILKHDNHKPKLGIETDIKKISLREREVIIKRLERLVCNNSEKRQNLNSVLWLLKAE
ncbi:P-loop NTPase fold protein [Pseudoalteromonas carrageenovora]|uniref:P-loop NTPase fold protein n=1 Tax=Pseudoalteromonas carrageenovora TaxID=227 RepID=UPI00311DBE5C